MAGGEIMVVPRNGKGHLFPCMELCKHLLLRDYNITLLLPSDLSSSVPSYLLQSSLFQLSLLSSSSPPSSSDPFLRFHHHMTQSIEALLTHRHNNGSTPPVCAVIDHIMSNTHHVFSEFAIPTVTFVTSSACWASVQHASWVVQPADMIPGEIRKLPGLPNVMVLSYSDLKQRRPWLPPPSHAGGSERPRGPPLPGEPAPWVEEVKNSVAILFNTCDDLEHVFLDYVADLTQKPVWGVGPLLPDQFWKSSDSVLLDGEIRPDAKSNNKEDEIMEWLHSKPLGSVIYVSFGSEVSPAKEEYPKLAKALEESTRPFIWVIQIQESGKEVPIETKGLSEKVGKRGMIVYGWAPQLMILRHKSTGGFITHCGWNSTVEAIVGGVPLIAWPIRGDQYYNAKLVVSYLEVGIMVSERYPEADSVQKEDIMNGIEKVLSDENIRQRADHLKNKFMSGFPSSSLASFDAFTKFINQQAA